MIEHPVINRDPEIMSGTPVFMGTRVPVVTLLDYLEDEQALAEFLDNFPSVKLEQAIALLEMLKQMLVAEPNESPIGRRPASAARS